MSRTIKLRMIYPHPGDQYLELCCGTLNGKWVVSTRNVGVGGHFWGHYFEDDELAATRYFYKLCAEKCEQRAAQFRAMLAVEDHPCWANPSHWVAGLPPECHGEDRVA